jgi:hypothetical protein
VYPWIIQNVIEKMAIYFADQGLDESVLQELQQMWEQKLYSSKVGNFPALPYQESFITSSNVFLKF